LFIGIFVGGVLPGWHVIVGDNQCGTNPYVWYFMGVRSRCECDNRSPVSGGEEVRKCDI
jgi:hypothetical protein